MAVVSAQQSEHARALRPSASSEVSLCLWEGAGLDEFMEMVFSIIKFIDQKARFPYFLVRVHSRDYGCRRLHNFSFRYFFFLKRRRYSFWLANALKKFHVSQFYFKFKMPMIV